MGGESHRAEPDSKPSCGLRPKPAAGSRLYLNSEWELLGWLAQRNWQLKHTAQPPQSQSTDWQAVPHVHMSHTCKSKYHSEPLQGVGFVMSQSKLKTQHDTM